MPQRVVVIWSCSLCNTEADSDDKVTQFQLSGGGRILGYDICTTCVAAEPFASVLAAGLSENAKGRTAPSSEDGRVQCEYCAKSYTPQGMGLHKKAAHNVKSATDVLLESRGKAGKFVCEECGFKTVNHQGLGAHKRAKHKVTGTSRAAVAGRGKRASA